MTFERIEALIRAAQGRGLASLEFSEGGTALRVAFDPAPTLQLPSEEARPEASTAPASPATARTPSQPERRVISPGVGFLRLRHPAGSAVPAQGDRVPAQAILAFLQAGPLLQPVVAPRAGVLGRALADEGVGVGYGTLLFDFD